MNSFMDALERWCFRLSAANLLFICIVIAWQVFARKLLNDSPSWSEPAALLSLLYMVMLASAAGCRTHIHLGLAWFREQFPKGLQQGLLYLEFMLCILLGLAMAYYGFAMAKITAPYILPGLSVSMAFQYTPLVIGGILIIIFNAEQLSNSLELSKESAQ